LADAEKLPFRDNSFTCVTVSFALRNVRDISAVLSEMDRVVKGGGRIIILDLGKPRSLFFRKPYYFYFYKVVPRIGRLLARKGGYAYKYLPNSLTTFPAQDGIKEIMAKTGFEDICVYELTMGVAAVHVGVKAMCL
jgi:demethylmenaquinone methyltransferase/2-methoxy-6-polyprenyl-1,4-benzoquinol methylase